MQQRWKSEEDGGEPEAPGVGAAAQRASEPPTPAEPRPVVTGSGAVLTGVAIDIIPP